MTAYGRFLIRPKDVFGALHGEEVEQARTDLALLELDRICLPATAPPPGCSSEETYDRVGALSYCSNEPLQELRQLSSLVCAAHAQLERHVLRHVPHPAFRDIEADHADRVAELAVQQIGDDGFEVGLVDVRLAPGRPEAATEVVKHQIHIS